MTDADKKKQEATDRSRESRPFPGSVWIRVILILLACWHIYALVRVTANHLSYNVVLSASEDYCARVAYQMSTGKHCYVQDSISSDSLMYTPLSLQIQSLVIRLFGLDIRFQRVTSLLFGMSALVLLGIVVKKLTGSSFLGFIASCLFAGVDLDLGYWYVGWGPNGFHAFFVILALYILIPTIHKDPSWSRCMLATISLFACFWCKQTGLAYMIAGVAYLLLRNIRKGAACAAVAVALTAAAVGYYATRENSTFLFNTTSWLAADPIIWSRLWNPVLFPELTGRFGMLVAIILAGTFALRLPFKNFVRPEYLLLGASAIAGPFAELKYGSGNTQCLVFYAMLIICGISFLKRMIDDGRVAPLIASVLIGVQCLALYHDVSRFLFNDEDVRRYKSVCDIIATPDKTVHFWCYGYLNILAGKEMHAGFHRRYFDRYEYWPKADAFWKSNPFDIVISFFPWEDSAPIMLRQLKTHYTLVQDIPPTKTHQGLGSIRQRLLVFHRKEGSK